MLYQLPVSSHAGAPQAGSFLMASLLNVHKTNLNLINFQILLTWPKKKAKTNNSNHKSRDGGWGEGKQDKNATEATEIILTQAAYEDYNIIRSKHLL